VAVTDGTSIYIVGGYGPGGVTSTLWRYDPATNGYTVLPAYTTPTGWHGAAYLAGKIYRIAGCVDWECIARTSSVEIYTIASYTWASGPAYPLAASAMTAASDGSAIYTAGGIVDGAPGNTARTLRFDGATWDDGAVADLPAGRDSAASDWLGGRWLVAGGRTSGHTDSAVRWDPATNAWSDLPAMLVPAAQSGGAALDSAFYVAGGNNAQGFLYAVQRYMEVPCGTATPAPPGRRVYLPLLLYNAP
jgi:hypothetical protein